MIDLIREAASIQEFIESKNWDFYFIGGITVQVWGQPRLTQDIDFTLFTNLKNEPDYISAFLQRYRPKFSDAAEFALSNRVLPMFTDSGIGIDLTLGGLSDMSESLARSSYQEFVDGIKLRICSAEDLIILKTMAGRGRDWIDIESVVIRQNNLDWEYIVSTLECVTDNDGLSPRIDKLRSLKSQFYKQ
ncbi:MAG: nucleotidyl transferase AbiEii/AbiGii toxin family protein [Pyrinomonadaceae bacterium]